LTSHIQPANSTATVTIALAVSYATSGSTYVAARTAVVFCRSELHQLLQLRNLLDEHSPAISSLTVNFVLWNNKETAQLLASLIAQHGPKLAGLSVDFRACASDLSGAARAASLEAAEAAEELLAEALQQAAAHAEAAETGGRTGMLCRCVT
jgi:hypothetical protein